ncbi:hypothetical protein IAI10_11475 [Clostridium sp. 19966]|uniref:PsbP-related protein n=1 Tax=Clostridium sp. 19966 TaxID=2768166 RepID=UPI0028DF5A3A|nr:hypothetical protein [Clostridium sp. 19966]MDT8717279.1 hypothetical protein [Clostridium sp. 19966]
MRVIVLNRKRIGVTLIILGLMMILFVAESGVDHRLKMTALMQNGIESLKEYKIDSGNIKYKLPSDWTTSEKKFSGGEILYHNDFTSSDNKIHGFVEKWKLEEDLKTFLINSKKSAFNPESIKNYDVTPIKIKNYSAYLLTYDTKTSSNSYYRTYEYFIDQNKSFFRMSFSVQQSDLKENMPAIFEYLANTYEIS